MSVTTTPPSPFAPGLAASPNNPYFKAGDLLFKAEKALIPKERMRFSLPATDKMLEAQANAIKAVELLKPISTSTDDPFGARNARQSIEQATTGLSAPQTNLGYLVDGFDLPMNPEALSHNNGVAMQQFGQAWSTLGNE